MAFNFMSGLALIPYVLAVVIEVLAIIALVKYIKKN